MSDRLFLFQDEENGYETVSDKIIFDRNNDTEVLQQLKITSQNFLRVNDFDLGEEPNFEDYSNKQFLSYIEKSSRDNYDVIKKIEDTNTEINFRATLSRVYNHKKSPSGDKIFVLFLPDDSKKDSTGIDKIKNFITMILRLGCNEGLLISRKKLSSKSVEYVKYCNLFNGSGGNVFTLNTYSDDKFINILNHSFVPEVLKVFRTKEEQEEFGMKESITIQKLPRMTIDDPLVKFYRGKKGDIFKIKREIRTEASLLSYQIIYKIVFGYK